MPYGPYGRDELTAILPEGSSVEPIWQGGDRVVLGGVLQGACEVGRGRLGVFDEIAQV